MLLLRSARVARCSGCTEALIRGIAKTTLASNAVRSLFSLEPCKLVKPSILEADLSLALLITAQMHEVDLVSTQVTRLFRKICASALVGRLPQLAGHSLAVVAPAKPAA